MCGSVCFACGVEVTAEVASIPDIVLALRERLPLHAVQFHPESVLTPEGRGMLALAGQPGRAHEKRRPKAPFSNEGQRKDQLPSLFISSWKVSLKRS